VKTLVVAALVAVSQAALAQVAPSLSSESARKGADLILSVGKSTLLKLPDPVERISVGNPAVADVMAISSREIYLLGKDLGSTNVIIWAKGGPATVIDIVVSADASLLEGELAKLLPGETDIKVSTSADSIVLTGSVSDAVKAAQASEIAQAWVRRLTRGLVMPVSSGAGTAIQIGQTTNPAVAARVAGPSVINMLKVRAPMQVMLEVKVAEVSKTLLSRLGVSVRQVGVSGNTTIDFLSQSNFVNQLLGAISLSTSARHLVQIDGQIDEGLIKLLAEPNIMAVSGQEASFRAGGKIFIPVARRNDVTGGSTITLEEKEFGVGVKFKPTVLENGLINLQVAPEVSELQQNGTPFTSVDGAVSVLPSFTLRRAETTIQLRDGQSFMIAGLMQSNTSATLNRFPGLGDLPILGVLFRSSQFQSDKSELMFVITPRLVKPLPADYALPTDPYIPPSLPDLHLHGDMEGRRAGAEPRAGGFDRK
jgi:pilus assembly protein CpaC